MLFKFGKIESPPCFLSDLKVKTLLWNYLWNQLHYFLFNSLNIPPLNPQSLIFA